MAGEAKTFSPAQIMQELSRLFMREAHDRQVYCVFGPYDRLRPFQKRVQEERASGGFNTTHGQVEYISFNRDLFGHLKAVGKYEQAGELADRRRDQQLKTILSDAFRDLVTTRIEAPGTLALFLADFEILYAYELGGHDISLARQVAINGKRICLLVPGAWRDGRLWIFDEDPESRTVFPDTLLFSGSGWVFELSGS